MLTLRYIEEMMTNSLRTPLTLCDRLGLKPTETQYELLTKLEGQPQTVDLEMDDRHEVLKAVAMYALWRTLAYRGARCTIISSDRGLASAFMGFLQEVTTEIDPALNSAVRWKRWNVMEIGHEAGHEVRCSPNQPVCVAGLHCNSHTMVVLGAGGSDTAFVETLMVLRPHESDSGASTVRLW